MRRTACIALLGLTAAACDSEDPGNQTLRAVFQLSRGGAEPVDCSAVSGIDEVGARLTDANGALVPGAPTSADCAMGVYEAFGVPEGSFELELAARGDLSGAPTVLFQGKGPVVAPGDNALVLAPRVAFLELAWTFGQDELAPCGTEVDTVDVILSTGSGSAGGFRATYGCTDTPITIDAPLDLREYTISVTANSAEGFPLFTHQASRLLDRGLNQYTASLMPQGRQVIVDWDFVVVAGDTPVRACDAERIQVTEATVTIENLEGGAVVSETVACTDRPHAFRAARFTQGRMLKMSVEAMGRERFYAEETFTMPAMDRVGDRLELHAVSTATISAQIATATCAPGQVDGVQLTLTVEGAADPWGEAELDVDTPTALENVWYGTYLVEASVMTAQGPICTRTERRVVDGPTSAWGQIVF